MKIFFLLLLLLHPGIVFITKAQVVIQWQRIAGGTGDDAATSIQNTTDGGYVIAGSSSSNDGDITDNHGSDDYWIVKLDSEGSIGWKVSLGGTGADKATSIQQTTDGGYIVAGSSESSDGDVTGNHGSDDYWIVKLDSEGSIEWQISLGGTGSDVANSIQQTTDGGYIIAGTSASNDGDVTNNHGSDEWIVKLDNAGTIEWQHALGGTGADRATSIQQTTDGGYIVAGMSESNDGDASINQGVLDYWIVKLDSEGAIQWQRSLGGTADEYANSIQQTSDGGYIVAGSSESSDGDLTGNHGVEDYWIVKLNIAGIIEWQQVLGGTGTDVANSILQTTDGGYIIAGTSASNDGDITDNHGSYDNWIVKLDSSGIIEWQKSLGGTDGDVANSIQQTTDGGYIAAGFSKSNDGDVTGNHGGWGDYWIVKLLPDALSVNPKNNEKCLRIYPNPTSSELNIELFSRYKKAELSLLNVLGEKIWTQNMTTDKYTIIKQFDLSGYPNGTYFLSIQTDKENTVQRIVKQD